MESRLHAGKPQWWPAARFRLLLVLITARRGQARIVAEPAKTLKSTPFGFTRLCATSRYVPLQRLTRTTSLVNPIRTTLDVIVTPAELDEALALDPEMLFLDQRLFTEGNLIRATPRCIR